MRLALAAIACSVLQPSAATYDLKATSKTAVVGHYWFDAKPVLKIQSGDTVKIRTATGDAARAIVAAIPKEDRGPGGMIRASRMQPERFTGRLPKTTTNLIQSWCSSCACLRLRPCPMMQSWGQIGQRRRMTLSLLSAQSDSRLYCVAESDMNSIVTVGAPLATLAFPKIRTRGWHLRLPIRVQQHYMTGFIDESERA